MPAKVFLHGLALAGYRSFGNKIQRIGPLGAINFFAGPNNSGKSNILRFLWSHLQEFKKPVDPFKSTITLQPCDKHRTNENTIVGIAQSLDPTILANRVNGNKTSADLIVKILSLEEFSATNGLYWTDYHSQGLLSNMLVPFDLPNMLQRLNRRGITSHALEGVAKSLIPNVSGTVTQMMENILNKLVPQRGSIPSVVNVPAFRVIDAAPQPNNPETHNGTGLIHQLSKLQNYSTGKRSDGDKFIRIRDFVRKVIGDDTAELRIPHELSSIAVTMNGIDLSLESLGTGVHHTILLAAMATIVEDSIVCLEEPETNLHPILQRSLIRYLANETSNQYFIATHSAHLLDCGLSDLRGSAFRIRLENGSTIVTPISSAGDRWVVCKDLGYHASDIVQSNCVIWVEGPSDRIYLNYWIQSVDAALVEGIHYSIMFYGGALLNYLTGCDDEAAEEFKEFVALRRLNRNSVVIMDSDKKSKHARIGGQKRRIEEEFKEDGMAWITKGRTIENYLTDAIRRKAFLAAHPRSERRYGGDGQFVTVTLGNERFNKVKMAKCAVAEPFDLSVLDLRSNIAKLVAYIRRCNPQYDSK